MSHIPTDESTVEEPLLTIQCSSGCLHVTDVKTNDDGTLEVRFVHVPAHIPIHEGLPLDCVDSYIDWIRPSESPEDSLEPHISYQCCTPEQEQSPELEIEVEFEMDEQMPLYI
jgi:hypothetical protein